MESNYNPRAAYLYMFLLTYQSAKFRDVIDLPWTKARIEAAQKELNAIQKANRGEN